MIVPIHNLKTTERRNSSCIVSLPLNWGIGFRRKKIPLPMPRYYYFLWLSTLDSLWQKKSFEMCERHIINSLRALKAFEKTSVSFLHAKLLL